MKITINSFEEILIDWFASLKYKVQRLDEV